MTARYDIFANQIGAWVIYDRHTWEMLEVSFSSSDAAMDFLTKKHKHKDVVEVKDDSVSC